MTDQIPEISSDVSTVTERQAAEGRKIQIFLDRGRLAELMRGNGVDLVWGLGDVIFDFGAGMLDPGDPDVPEGESDAVVRSRSCHETENGQALQAADSANPADRAGVRGSRVCGYSPSDDPSRASHSRACDNAASGSSIPPGMKWRSAPSLSVR
jgi:hypothetical protein